ATTWTDLFWPTPRPKPVILRIFPPLLKIHDKYNFNRQDAKAPRKTKTTIKKFIFPTLFLAAWR
ncbi:MAG TPA: hypothetical protein VK859_11745, partial [bacterium]|nr:hypothetical protein [bacterium]